MIAIKSSGWVQEVISAFMEFSRIGAETCFGLHFIRLVSVGGLLGLSRGLRPPCPDFLFFP